MTVSEKTVTLTLTEKCNLNCIYCYESDRSNVSMAWDIAKEIIDREMSADDGTEKVHIDFFGGEPFIEFELLKKILEYLYTTKWSKKFSCGTSTNGTLVHGKIKQWLKENHHRIEVGLSFDGNKAMQDYNRSNSFDRIDLDFFRKYWPRNSAKMTISQESLHSLADGVIFLHQKGYYVNCNLGYGLDWTQKELVAVLERELQKLIKFYLENPSIEPCRMLGAKIEYVTGEIKPFIKKWCGTGTHMHTYDVHGNVYPCQFFMPLSMGKERSASARGLSIPSEIPAEYFGENCANCPLTPVCPTCLGSNYCETGDLYKKAPGFCELQKTILAANAYLKWYQLQMGLITPNDTEKYRLLRGIKVINEYIAKG